MPMKDFQAGLPKGHGASTRMGARNDGMRNICELLINVVIFDRPKMLTGLGQKARGMVEVFVFHFT